VTARALALGQAADFVAQVRWQFAHTMPEWPHEYTVQAWQPKRAAQFEAMCRAIAVHGVVESWPPPPEQPIYHHPYLVLGDHKYWAMGPHGDQDEPQDMTVINRVQVRLEGPAGQRLRGSSAAWIVRRDSDPRMGHIQHART